VLQKLSEVLVMKGELIMSVHVERKNYRARGEVNELSHSLAALAPLMLRYSLVIVIGWIGLMKFTGYEAEAIKPLVSNSPLMSWVYGVFSVGAFSTLLGVVEVLTALLIAVRPLSAKVGIIGGILAVMTFLTTLTFLISTPGWEPSLGGFPTLSVVPGQFIIKDLVLLAAAVWSVSDALED
jgi:uncharacterized membrane protein YkgB